MTILQCIEGRSTFESKGEASTVEGEEIFLQMPLYRQLVDVYQLLHAT